LPVSIAPTAFRFNPVRAGRDRYWVHGILSCPPSRRVAQGVHQVDLAGQLEPGAPVVRVVDS